MCFFLRICLEELEDGKERIDLINKKREQTISFANKKNMERKGAIQLPRNSLLLKLHKNVNLFHILYCILF